MFKHNLGTVDRVLRFALAVWWLGSPWTPDFPGWSGLVALVIAWIALVESFIGYCWLHQIFGINNKDQ